jgi:hypothetical protein
MVKIKWKKKIHSQILTTINYFDISLLYQCAKEYYFFGTTFAG